MYFRKPILSDAHDVYELVKRCKPLDLNSRYAYMLVCTHFANTSIICEVEKEVLGFVSAYTLPDMPDIFFVWQVAVDEKLRGKKVALTMLEKLFEYPNLQNIQFIDTTISPSNIPSQKLFEKFARVLHTNITKQVCFSKTLFGEDEHEDEVLYRLGKLHTKEKNNANI